MGEKIADVFDGKVFHPAEFIDLPANTRVQITIETLPPEEQETVAKHLNALTTKFQSFF